MMKFLLAFIVASQHSGHVLVLNTSAYELQSESESEKSSKKQKQQNSQVNPHLLPVRSAKERNGTIHPTSYEILLNSEFKYLNFLCTN